MPDDVTKRSRRSGVEMIALARAVARHRSRPGSGPGGGVAAASVGMGAPLSSVDHDEKVADLDRIANGHPDALDRALARCTELVLHLHRLDDEDLLAGLDAVPHDHGDGCLLYTS